MLFPYALAETEAEYPAHGNLILRAAFAESVLVSIAASDEARFDELRLLP